MALISLHPNEATAALAAPLAVVMPIYNEAANISQVLEEWFKTFNKLDLKFQFLLVNDGSKDNTLEILKKLETEYSEQLVVIDKPNSGHGRSCRLGYDAAVASLCVEWVLQIDSDGQCDPSYFQEFWKQRDDFDCIFGQRIKRDDGLARTMTSKICKLGATLLGGRNMGDPNVPYRLIRREVLREALQRIPPSFNIHNVAITYVLKKTGEIRWKYIPIRFLDRQGGNNSINLLNVAQWGIDMLLELRRLK
ncbi:MAG: glycosyltransferase family 2 protein [Chthoniobacterales bacterium]|nr:glycosyltransferase family 2 protein [Chthoniobacterales bacterium]